MNLTDLNTLDHDPAAEIFLGCCGTPWWAQQMAHARPYTSAEQMHDTADGILDAMDDGHWLQAFAAHPRLGDRDSLRMKFAGNEQWSADEQAGVNEVDDATLDDLAERNDAYEKKFGHTFILCASGLTAGDMLDALRKRLRNHVGVEAKNAAQEQRKITHLRLGKMLGEES